MAKKKGTRRFVTVRTSHDGKEWQFSVPDYIGKVKVGDTVVVGEPGCRCCFAFGEVVSTDPCAVHRDSNIRPIVDKVKVKRWEKCVGEEVTRNLLMRDMARRQEKIDALARFRASAESDAAMCELLAEYDRLS